jgi:two-component system response regulator FixJ
MSVQRMVHIVDDDGDDRRSLERLLQAAGYATKSYDSSSAFLRTIGHSATWGCVLVDVRMPGMDGLELQAHLRGRRSTMPVVMMTGHADIGMAVRAMKAGATDFIEKPFAEVTVLNAIDLALARHTGVDRERETHHAARRIARLSKREREVLDALVSGRSNKMIAFDLHLSVRTVEVHRARMMHRLGVRQLAAAVRLAVMAGLATDVESNRASS